MIDHNCEDLTNAVDYPQPQAIWNNTAMPFPEHRCVHELIEEQVTKTPEAIALIIGNQHLSYTALNTQANQLAHYLIATGVKPEARVAICLEHSFNLVIALVAILKAGGAYVPVDPESPIERIVAKFAEGEPVVLLTQHSLQTQFADINIPLINLDATHCPWADHPRTNIRAETIGLTPKNLAYIIYTSGSTGTPKGVMIEHRNVVNFLTTTAVKPGLSKNDTVLAFTTIAFDIAISELLLPLIQGAKIVLVNRAEASNPLLLQEIVQKFNITMMQATPTRWRMLLNTNWQGSKQLKALCGGESLSVQLGAELVNYVGELWNMYGPTEATVAASCLRIDEERPILPSFEAIGRPLANVQIYILDHELQILPINSIGELYIAGAGVGRGYWKQAYLTQERFIDNPFCTTADAKLYKTGDLARWLSDGSIEFIGRNDSQVKLFGYRVELGEIEAKLAMHIAIAEVAVIAKSKSTDEQKLIAYISLKQGFALDSSELRNYLKSKLPSYLVPADFVILPSLPITSNGKLDRQELSAIEYSQAKIEEKYQEHKDNISEKLSTIWCETLGINSVYPSLTDNFFDLGGNSLMVIELTLKINKIFEINLPFGIIYQFPTISELQGYIASGYTASGGYSIVPIKTKGSRPPLFAIHTITLSDLPRYLDDDQPLYFIRYGMAAESYNQSVNLPPLVALAKHYIQEIKTVQPQGPYHLLGFSFGGVIAYEIACQLNAEGDTVNFTGLIDTYLDFKTQSNTTRKIVYELLNKTPFQLYKLINQKIKSLLNYKKTSSFSFYPHIYTTDPDRLCMQGYIPQKNEQTVITLFQAFDFDSIFYKLDRPEQAWRMLLDANLEIRYISGIHIEVFIEPHVKILAQTLNACLDKAIKK